MKGAVFQAAVSAKLATQESLRGFTLVRTGVVAVLSVILLGCPDTFVAKFPPCETDPDCHTREPATTLSATDVVSGAVS